MILEPPQPPTAPAPAIRPTPPTPPRLDKSPFVKEKSNVTVDTPETMARDAVAHGSGALTKRTVDRGNEETPPANQTVTVIPPDAPLVEDTQSDYDRGQDVLREFRDLDARQSQSAYSTPAQTSTEQPQTSTPHLTHQEGHGAIFWILTIILVAVATFIIAKKFLFTEKPALTKSQLFDDEIKTTPENPPPPKPAVKPAPPPEKKSDEKRPRFEVRV